MIDVVAIVEEGVDVLVGHTDDACLRLTGYAVGAILWVERFEQVDIYAYYF